MPESSAKILATAAIHYRAATLDDMKALLRLEQTAFDTDRMNNRSFIRQIKSANNLFIVAEKEGELVGYVLLFLLRGTSLARLYSIAVSAAARGLGVGQRLIELAEEKASEKGKLFIRLEVREDNVPAIRLYQKLGYKVFGRYSNYYQDHTNALRLQKQIVHFESRRGLRQARYYEQQTDFTCGPAALMIAISAWDQNYRPNLSDELQIWREATTIFMTSGHGGCHPFGLALAARRRGYDAEVWISQDSPLFVDTVRQQERKRIMTQVHDDYLSECEQQNIAIHYRPFGSHDVEEKFHQGWIPVILVSLYHFDKKKAPHWVTLIAEDEHCFYVHDPDNREYGDYLDKQYMAVPREIMGKASRYGSARLQSMILIRAHAD